jgi:hypothetical protein
MRRSLLFLALSAGSLALVCIAPGSRLFAQTKGATNNRSVQDFKKHWTTAKALAVAVAQAMPAEDYSFQPVPAEMSSGEQMMHITAANYGYGAFLGALEVPVSKAPKRDERGDRQRTRRFGCSKIYDGVTDTQLDQIRGTGDHTVDGREVILGAPVHMSRHRPIRGLSPAEGHHAARIQMVSRPTGLDRLRKAPNAEGDGQADDNHVYDQAEQHLVKFVRAPGMERRQRQYDIAHYQLNGYSIEQAAHQGVRGHKDKLSAGSVVNSRSGEGDEEVDEDTQQVHARAALMGRLPANQPGGNPQWYAATK